MSSANTSYSTIRRSRPSYRCLSCQQRRVKCDQDSLVDVQERPRCGSCVKTSAECVYTTEPDTRKRKASVGDDGNDRQKRTVSDDDIPHQLQQGYLVLQNGGRSRYTESSFWACVDSRELQLDAVLPNLPLYPLRDIPHAEAAGTRFYPGSGIEIGLSDSFLMGLTWNCDTCCILLEDFLAGVHPLIPLMHTPTFRQLVAQFWQWYSTWDQVDVVDGLLTEDPSFLPLYLSVLLGGMKASGRNNANCDKLRDVIPRTLSIVGFPENPSMHSLMAFVIYKSMMMREEESLSSGSFMSIAVRVAQSMGLHRDGSDFNLNPVDAEVRRRVWWYLMHLDAMTSLMSGLPPVASHMISNTSMIGTIRDDLIGQVSPDAPDNSAYTDENLIFSSARYEISACMHSMLAKQGAWATVTLAEIYAEEAKLAALYQTIRDRIKNSVASAGDLAGISPPEQSSEASSSGTSSSNHPPVIIEWSNDLVGVTLEKAFYILYQPLLQDKALWTSVRSRAVPHLQHLLSSFTGMSINSSYRHFQWLYPGCYQPLQPLAALLVDISTHPQSPEAMLSRHLVEEVFSMLGSRERLTGDATLDSGWPDNTPSTGARLVWTVLRKLYIKVWSDLGWEPIFEDVSSTTADSASLFDPSRSASYSEPKSG